MKQPARSIPEVVDGTLNELCADPTDVFNSENGRWESDYLQAMRECYQRTAADVVGHFLDSGNGASPPRLLEIGAWLGAVSLTLKQLGFQVTAQDITEFMNHPKLRDRLKHHGIPASAVNLRDGRLPYEDESFDGVIMCEVIEHLNFNPLPVLAEINRVLRKGGLLYLATPNATALRTRLRLLAGRSVHNPIADYFFQLRGDSGMIVGLHWREYSAAELKEMLCGLGFDWKTARYHRFSSLQNQNPIRRNALRLLYRVRPDFLPSLVVFAVKREPARLAVKYTESSRA